jgi:hypothetical protein
MLQSGKYLSRIVPADAMVIDFGVKIKLWRCEIAVSKLGFKGMKRTLYSAHQSDKLHRKV